MIGVIAQLGERLNGIQEVGGSIPLNSTIYFSRWFYSRVVKKTLDTPLAGEFANFDQI